MDRCARGAMANVAGLPRKVVERLCRAAVAACADDAPQRGRMKVCAIANVLVDPAPDATDGGAEPEQSPLYVVGGDGDCVEVAVRK